MSRRDFRLTWEIYTRIKIVVGKIPTIDGSDMSFLKAPVSRTSLGARQLAAVRRGIGLFGTLAALAMVFAHQASPASPLQQSCSGLEGTAQVMKFGARLVPH